MPKKKSKAETNGLLISAERREKMEKLLSGRMTKSKMDEMLKEFTADEIGLLAWEEIYKKRDQMLIDHRRD